MRSTKAPRLATDLVNEPHAINPAGELEFREANPHSPKNQHRGGRAARHKGDRIERQIVRDHLDLGIKAERYPLSGASRFRGSGHDVDIYIFGTDEAPCICEVKGRKGGAGFVTLEKWLGDYDALFLRRDNTDPLIVLPWRIWSRLIKQVRR